MVPTPAREVQWLWGLVQSKELNLQKMSRLVDEASSLLEELSMLKEDKDHVVEDDKFMLTIGTLVFNLNATTSLVVRCIQKVKDCAVEVKRDVKRAHETTEVWTSFEKTLNEKVSSLMIMSSPVSFGCVDLRTNLNDVTALVQGMKVYF